jgi:hypothetical protein
MDVKHELQIIISGVGDYSAKDFIKAAAHHIGEGQKTGRSAEESGFSKEQETKKLIEWIQQRGTIFYRHCILLN